MNRVRATLVNWLYGGTALAVAGLLSAWLSLADAEVRTARSLFGPSVAVIWVHLDPPDERLTEIWQKAGVPHSIWKPPADFPSGAAPPPPWVRIRPAELRAPFLASVEYAWQELGPGSGGGRAWYLCLFGLTVRLGEPPPRQS